MSKINIQNYLTRAEKLKLSVHMPSSTSSRVIVSANNEGIGFRFDQYDEARLRDHISKSAFDATVRGAHKICETVWSIRKMEEEKVYNVWSKRIFILSIIVLLISLILITIKSYGGHELGDGLVIVAIVLVVVSSVATLSLIVHSMLMKPKFIDFESTITERLESYFAKENEKYPNGRLKWIVPDKFYWLELHIDGATDFSVGPNFTMGSNFKKPTTEAGSSLKKNHLSPGKKNASFEWDSPRKDPEESNRDLSSNSARKDSKKNSQLFMSKLESVIEEPGVGSQELIDRFNHAEA